MQTVFLNDAGVVQFARDDMEQGNWTQEEYTVNATFPFVAGKVITRGMRIMFRDPADDSLQAFEIRNVTNVEPEHYQQIIAEHIAVSELSDEHINTKEITNQTAQTALTFALSGTTWTAGNTVSRSSSVNIARGSVWQAVNAIASNYNAYAVPRVVTDAAGNITGKYIDLIETTGTWRGVRLSIDKNMSDASVVYDDSEVLTALYGYGGSVDVEQSGQEDKTEELTFAGVTWAATADHPAKPAGQTYLEDPAKTAIYGRNGRPRFGFYQNGDIKDANILLQKTWEALKNTSAPLINISGTCSDLHRFGYADQPIRLHDLALVEISETGESYYLQIIKLDVDLIDPTATRPEIGAYIPNIIYINRETHTASTGGGGRGGRGQTNTDYKQSETYTAIEKDDTRIAMVVGTRNGDNYIKAGEIALSINKSGESGQYESSAHINANHVNISATNDVHTLAGDVEHDAQGRLIIKNAGGMYVQRTESGVTSQFGVFDNGNLTGGVVVEKINGNGVTTNIRGDRIKIGTLDDEDLNSWATDAKNGTGVFVKFLTVRQLTAQEITTLLANIDEATINNLTVAQRLETGKIVIADTIQAGANSAEMHVADITKSADGKTLTITYTDKSAITFSKATTLSGAWGSGVFTVTATGANPLTTTLTNTGHWGNTNSGEDANTYYYATYATINSSGVPAPTGNVTTISGLARYNAGYTDGRNSVQTITPTAINVYSSQQGTLLSTRLSASILTAGKYITLKVGNTTYSIAIT